VLVDAAWPRRMRPDRPIVVNAVAESLGEVSVKGRSGAGLLQLMSLQGAR